jgi:hypothetical protein
MTDDEIVFLASDAGDASIDPERFRFTGSATKLSLWPESFAFATNWRDGGAGEPGSNCI